VQLTDRERKFVLAGIAFFVILVVYFGINFLRDNIFSIDARIKQSQIDEANLLQYGKEYRKLAILRTSEKVDLEPMVPQIESLLQKYGVRNNATLQPNDSVIENRFLKRLINIEFREIDAASLLNVIRELEDHNTIPYSIEFFQSVPLGGKPGLYRVSMKIAAFKNKD